MNNKLKYVTFLKAEGVLFNEKEFYRNCILIFFSHEAKEKRKMGIFCQIDKEFPYRELRLSFVGNVTQDIHFFGGLVEENSRSPHPGIKFTSTWKNIKTENGIWLKAKMPLQIHFFGVREKEFIFLAG